MSAKKISQKGLGICIPLVLFLAACGEWGKQPEFHISGPIMGTAFTVKAPKLPKPVEIAKLDEAIRSLLNDVNNRFSTYIDASELSQFNRTQSTDWVIASEAFVHVLSEALNVSQMTGGAFDITVGPLVNLWGFGPENRRAKIPDQASISAVLNSIGYQHLHTRDMPPSVKKDRPDIYVDLSAIAKGYAVDRVAEYLERLEINNYMIEIGGELRAKGLNSNAQPWRIAIEKPLSEIRVVDRVFAIDNAAVATSGDYRNYFEADGERYSHTIDPLTGAPIKHKLASVTVLGHTTMTVDAVATALMVLGPDKGFELARKHKIAALFFVKNEKEFVERETRAFSIWVKK